LYKSQEVLIEEDYLMKKIAMIMLFAFCGILSVYGQAQYIGVINYVQGDLERITNGKGVAVCRNMVIYANNIIDYAPDGTGANGEVQIILSDGVFETISSFPKEFKINKYKVVSKDELADLQDFIGGNLVLSTKEPDSVFSWYCNLKQLDPSYVRNLKIEISEKESSPALDSVSPLVFQLNSGVSIKEIKCYASILNKPETLKLNVQWVHDKDWFLDFKNLPVKDEEIYVLNITFVLSNGKEEARVFQYQVFSEQRIKDIEKEATDRLPRDAKKFKKNDELIKKYEEYGLLLPVMRIRKEANMKIKGLLEELWYEEI
jgi:hypothetical protein